MFDSFVESRLGPFLESFEVVMPMLLCLITVSLAHSWSHGSSLPSTPFLIENMGARFCILEATLLLLLLLFTYCLLNIYFCSITFLKVNVYILCA